MSVAPRECNCNHTVTDTLPLLDEIERLKAEVIEWKVTARTPPSTTKQLEAKIRDLQDELREAYGAPREVSDAQRNKLYTSLRNYAPYHIPSETAFVLVDIFCAIIEQKDDSAPCPHYSVNGWGVGEAICTMCRADLKAEEKRALIAEKDTEIARLKQLLEIERAATSRRTHRGCFG